MIGQPYSTHLLTKPHHLIKPYLLIKPHLLVKPHLLTKPHLLITLHTSVTLLFPRLYMYIVYMTSCIYTLKYSTGTL